MKFDMAVGFSYSFFCYAIISPNLSVRCFFSSGIPSKLGYFSSNRLAAFCIVSKNLILVIILSGMSAIPDCLVPNNSPGQRYCRSNSANLKPSLVCSSALSLL